jgi:hypothetical protein
MANFAEIDENNTVLRVLVVPDEQEGRGQEFLSHDLKLGGTWKQTSADGKLRKNFASIGYKYDSGRDAFIAPEPKNNIGFNEETCSWIMPEKPIIK